MPDVHIVDRYFDTVNAFDVQDDGIGLDYYIPKSEEVNPIELHSAFKGQYMVIVVGANHFTKQIPIDKIVYIANKTGANAEQTLVAAIKVALDTIFTKA